MPQNTIELEFGAFLLRLRRALSYDPATGELRWRITKGRCIEGAIAGKTCANGYRYVGFEGDQWLVHRLIWALHYGELPPEEIDHKDRNSTNNAIENLRASPPSMNQGNSGIWRTNSSGFRGVSWDKGRCRWAAYIWRKNRKYHLGYFADRAEAAGAYDCAAAEYFGEFASLNLAEAA